MRTYGIAPKSRFGRLVVVRRAESTPAKATRWECLCDCGNTAKVMRANLTSGATRSCGCLQREIATATLRRYITKHGQSKTRTYSIWKTMIARCANSNGYDWPQYGGRGIKVCKRWHKFENFIADMGHAPEGESIDRYPNNDGDYKPSNCRWATLEQQANNTRRNRFLTYQGEIMTLAQWARRFGIAPSSLHARIDRLGESRAMSLGRKK